MTVLSRNVKTALTAVACLWAIFFLGIILRQFWSVDIRSFGIQPREAEGLAGILFWPLLLEAKKHAVASSIFAESKVYSNHRVGSLYDLVPLLSSRIDRPVAIT